MRWIQDPRNTVVVAMLLQQLMLCTVLRVVHSFSLTAPSRTRTLSGKFIIARSSTSSPLRTVAEASITRRSETSLLKSSKSPIPAVATIPSNEFSRTISPEHILDHKSGRRSGDGRSNPMGMPVSISATDVECQALAERFDLKLVTSLDAHVVVRRHSSIRSGLEVEGRVLAALTRTCVRTNQDFPVQVELPIYAIVKPVPPRMGILQVQTTNYGDDDNSVSSSSRSEDKTNRGRDGAFVSFRTRSMVDDLDLMEIQRIASSDGSDDSDDGRLDDGDESSFLMEDEAIFPIGGQLDVGELVSQLFWLNLDPYPKKPGTDPVQRSITG